jgi:ABC-type multidrug transport system ATPase subunit
MRRKSEDVVKRSRSCFTTRGCSLWCSQYTALVRLHYLLSIRTPITLITQISLGFVLCALLIGFQSLANFMLGGPILHPPTTVIPILPSCVSGDHSVRPGVASGTLIPGCSTLMYAPNTPMVRRLMTGISNATGLEMDVDVIPVPNASTPPWDYTWVNRSLFNANSSMTCLVSIGDCKDPSYWLSGECIPCSFATDNRTLTLWHADHPNSTQNSIFVFGAYVEDSSYSILYNITLLSFPFFADSHLQSLKNAIDTALLTGLAMNSGIDFNHSVSYPLVDLHVQSKSFPRPAPNEALYDVFASNGGLWMYVAPAACFFVLLNDLVHEKESLLRVSMVQAGLMLSAFWIAWATKAVVINTALCLVLLASGYAFNFALFTHASPIVTFILFMSFSLSMSALAALLSTFTKTARGAQTTGFFFLLSGFVFEAITCSSYAGLLDLLYANELNEERFARASKWIIPLRQALHVYPPFSFAYALASISNEASIAAHGKSRPVSVSDLFIADERVFLGFTCLPPPTIHFIEVLLYSAIAFSVLAVYFDAVLPGPQGTTSHPLFCLGCRFRRPATLPDSSVTPNENIDRSIEPFSLMKPPCHSGYYPHRVRTNTPVLILGSDSNGETVKGASEALTILSEKGDNSLHPRVKYMIASSKFSVIDEELEEPLLSSTLSSREFDIAASDVEEDSGVVRETFATLSREGNDSILARVMNLRVVYRSGWSGVFHSLTGIEFQPLAWLGLPPLSRWTGILFVPTGYVMKARRRIKRAMGGIANTPMATLLNEREERSERKSAISQPRAKPTASDNSGAGDVVAVDDLTFSIKKNEVLAILGHNGAGKTTTISVMTGLVRHTSGVIEIAGRELHGGAGETEGLIGVCPQNDCLWPSLSSRETLSLFSAIKGVNSDGLVENDPIFFEGEAELKQESHVSTIQTIVSIFSSAFTTSEVIRKIIDKSLDDVNLLSVQHRPSSTLSGGMRRRLSMAVASLGSPKLLFLDEPTTGMDPVNREAVWTLIRKLKLDASVVLTTHAMEEADALGDRVGIMGGGRLVAIGDPLALKLRYGDGYRLSIVLRDNTKDAFETAKKEVLSHVPLANISLWDAANVVFTIPFHKSTTDGHHKNAQLALPGLLDWCERASTKGKGGLSESQEPLLVEYGISGPTLEQAFLRVSSLVDFDLARSAEAGGKEDTPVSLDGSASKKDADTRLLSSPRFSLSQSQQSFDILDGPFIQQRGALELDAAFNAGGIGSEPRQNRTISLTGRASSASDSPRGVTLSPCSFQSPMSINTAQDIPSVGSSIADVRSSAEIHTMNRSKKRKSESTEEHDTPTCSYGIKALIIKATTLVLRERTLFLCQVITPLLVLAILVALRFVIVAEVGGTAVISLPPVTLPLNAHLWLAVNNDDEIAPQTSEKYLALYYNNALRPHSVTRRPENNYLHISNKSGVASSPENRNCVQFFLAGIDASIIEQPPVHELPCRVQNECNNSAVSVKVNSSLLAKAVGYFGKITLAQGAYSNLTPSEIAAQLNSSAGLLGEIPSTWCEIRNESLISAPYWDLRGADADENVFAFDDEIMADLMILNKAPRNALANDFQPPCNALGELTPGDMNPYDPVSEALYCPAFLVPDASISFHDVSSPFMIETVSNEKIPAWLPLFRLSYTLQVNDLSDALLHRPNGLSQQDDIPYGVGFPLTPEQAKIEVMDLVIRGYAKWSGLDKAQRLDKQLENAHFDMPLVVMVTSFPETIEVALSQLVDIIGSVLFPVTLTLLLPLFLFLAVLEKERGLVELQLAMGMNWFPYIAVNYFLNLVIYCCVASVFWGISALLDFSFFANTSPALLAIILFGWGLNVCSLATTIAALTSNRHVAVHVGFVLSLLIPLLSTAIAAGIYGLVAQQLGSGAMAVHMPSTLFLVPLFGPCLAFVRIIYLGNFHCLMQRRCITDLNLAMTMEDGEIRRAITALFFSAFVYQCIGLYLDNIMPRTFGTRQHLCFCLPRAVRRRAGKTFSRCWLTFDSWRSHSQGTAMTPISTLSPLSTSSTESLQENTSLYVHIARWAKLARLSLHEAVREYAKGEDEDVYKERMVVEYAARNRAQGTAQSELERVVLGQRFPIFLKGLRKEFPVNASLGVKVGLKTNDEETEETEETAAGALKFGGPVNMLSAKPTYKEIEQSALLAQRVMRPEYLLQGGAGTKVAVSDLSLAIEGGSCFGLLGENGCGKSTTLSIIVGLLTPTDGKAFVNGYDVERESSGARASLGVCPQMDCLWPTLTVGEHLLYYARLKGVPESIQADHVRKSLAEVGLAHVQNRSVSGLSGGMRRRVSLAIALVGRARVVLLDEPSTGLDPASKRRLWRLIENARRDNSLGSGMDAAGDSSFQDRGRALLLVSHDLEEVETLCDRISIMTHGRLRCLQTGANLRHLYGGRYTLSVRFELGGTATLEQGTTIITEQIPGSVVEAAYSSGYAVFSIPKASSEGNEARFLPLSRVFTRMLELQSETNVVTEFSLSQQSLDAIFRKIVQYYR